MNDAPEAVWEDIVQSHHDYIYNLAYYLCHERNEADDITQETFLKVFENLKYFRNESSIRTWLSRIAINTYKSTKRKKYKHQSICLEKIHPLTSLFNPERIIIRKDLQWCIHHVLQHHVSEEHKIILTLRHMNEMSYDEIAEVLDISVSAVKSRLHRARMAFKDHLVKSGCAKMMEDYTCYCEGVMECEGRWLNEL